MVEQSFGDFIAAHLPAIASHPIRNLRRSAAALSPGQSKAATPSSDKNDHGSQADSDDGAFIDRALINLPQPTSPSREQYRHQHDVHLAVDQRELRRSIYSVRAATSKLTLAQTCGFTAAFCLSAKSAVLMTLTSHVCA